VPLLINLPAQDAGLNVAALWSVVSLDLRRQPEPEATLLLKFCRLLERTRSQALPVPGARRSVMDTALIAALRSAKNSG
jgi:hypothetical protein